MRGLRLQSVIGILCWFFVFSPAPGQDSCLEVSTQFEGANPRTNSAISREAESRFRIRPFNEEGSNDAYYFRLTTKIQNRCDEDKGIELIIEWPALERHPDYEYDTYYYGDRGNWRWTYANVEHHEARVHLYVPPGVTYVGNYPKYDYQELLEFLSALPESPYLRKWVAGSSFYDRQIWAIRIEDPDQSSPADRILLITARNHPYETGGSYIVESMIRYLLSDDPDAVRLRRQHSIYFLPMMNPDGVVLGTNQRTRPGGINLSYGVGTDDPALTTLLNLVEEIRPGLWADVHSWPHKKDDGLWSTHKWVADGLLSRIPDNTFGEMIWKVSFVRERNTPDNHLWQWLLRTLDTGGVSLSISWYRRHEEDLEMIGKRLLVALADTLSEHKRRVE